MDGTMKEEQSLRLLKECSSGCKMALNSINQILEYTEDEMLEHIILEAKDEHERLEKKAGDLLRKAGAHEKEPGMAASVFAHIKADMKIMMNGGNCQIAKLLMDGCNMGIQSISESRNENPEASAEVSELAAKLIRCEEDFMKKLRKFL